AARVAADQGALLMAEVAHAETVDEADTALARDALERRAQRLEVGVVEAAAVDPARAANDDRRLRGGPQHERVELLASGLGVLLGVVQTRERAAVRQGQALEVEQHGRRHERAGETSAR